MGSKINELVSKYSSDEDHAGRDVILNYSSITDIVLLQQDDHFVYLDPWQVKDIYNRLISLGAI